MHPTYLTRPMIFFWTLLTYPITSNEAERSFSKLKLLLASTRSAMGEARLNNLVLMGTHKSRLSKISTEIIIQKFKEKPRHAKLQKKIVSDYIPSSDEYDSVDDEGSFYLLFIFIKTFYMNQNGILLTFFSEVFFKIRVSDPLYFLRLRYRLHMDSKTVNYIFISLKSNNDLKYKKFTILILISFFYHITFN